MLLLLLLLQLLLSVGVCATAAACPSFFFHPAATIISIGPTVFSSITIVIIVKILTFISTISTAAALTFAAIMVQELHCCHSDP